MNWMKEVQWARKYMKGQNGTTMVYIMAMANTVYHIWLERNSRIFQQKLKLASSLVRHVIKEIHGRGSRLSLIHI